MAAAPTTTTTNNWVVEVNEHLKTMADPSAEEEHWLKQSIYKLPGCVTDLNASFGPYHHGQDHLRPMEEHKQRALLHFLRRANKPLQLFVDAIAEVVQSLKDSYNPLEAPWVDDHDDDEGGFLRLMILDGCFMLEVLRIGTRTLDDYAPSDPVFSTHGRLYIMPYIRRDMVMLENQLPMLLLDKLVAVESNVVDDRPLDEEFVNKLILKLCLPTTPATRLGKCLHVLDVYKKSLLHDDQSSPGGKTRTRRRRQRRHRPSRGIPGDDHIMRSATKLHEAGIQFKQSPTESLRDISFRSRSGTLELPVIEVDDATESTYLNLIAYERFHVGAGNEVTSYMFLMDNIIDDESDVALLDSSGIIRNSLGSNKAVAKLFNSLSRDITLDPAESGLQLDVVHRMVNGYCRKAWNEWRANLVHIYLFWEPVGFVISCCGCVLVCAHCCSDVLYCLWVLPSQGEVMNVIEHVVDDSHDRQPIARLIEVYVVLV